MTFSSPFAAPPLPSSFVLIFRVLLCRSSAQCSARCRCSTAIAISIMICPGPVVGLCRLHVHWLWLEPSPSVGRGKFACFLGSRGAGGCAANSGLLGGGAGFGPHARRCFLSAVPDGARYGIAWGLPPSKCAGWDSVDLCHQPLDARVVTLRCFNWCTYRRSQQPSSRGPAASGSLGFRVLTAGFPPPGLQAFG